MALEQGERQQASMVTVWPNPQNDTELIVSNRSLDPVSNAFMTVYPGRKIEGEGFGFQTFGGKQVDIAFPGGLAPCTQYKITLEGIKKTASLGSAEKADVLHFQLFSFADSSGHSWARDSNYQLSDREGERTEFDFETGGRGYSILTYWNQLARNGVETELITECGPKG
ncbi:hypothetical protein [Streptomyces chartreusis]|uniref:hypothetical protein n=1 Tax=Streptomyces chartreusis TaxID=1969 RepID=UPI00363C083A